MRDRLSEWEAADDVDISADKPGRASSITKDAETALVSLGYKPPQAARAISLVLNENPDIADSETLIRLALKSML
jgi:Holliday junction DNA helicase RuvA